MSMILLVSILTPEMWIYKHSQTVAADYEWRTGCPKCNGHLSLYMFCLCFPDTANGYNQAEHNLASDLPPRSSRSVGTLTPASAHQPSHCKKQTFTFSEFKLAFHHQSLYDCWVSHVTYFCRYSFIEACHLHWFTCCVWLLSCWQWRS